jgi:hypothetical protein
MSALRRDPPSSLLERFGSDRIAFDVIRAGRRIYS